MDDAKPRFEHLYVAHYRAVLSYVRRRTSSLQDADDVTAATFLTAWRRFDEVTELDKPLAWLYAVAYRTLANHRRSARHAADIAERSSRTTEPSQPDRATEYVAARLDVARVLSALAALSERDQEVLRLVAFEELDPREIATVIGVRPATARTVLYRARRRLQQVLDALDDETRRRASP